MAATPTTIPARDMRNMKGELLVKLAKKNPTGKYAQVHALNRATALAEAQRRIDNGTTSRYPYEALGLEKPRHPHPKKKEQTKPKAKGKRSASSPTKTKTQATKTQVAVVESGNKTEAKHAFDLAFAAAPENYKQFAGRKAYGAVLRDGKSVEDALAVAAEATKARQEATVA